MLLFVTVKLCKKYLQVITLRILRYSKIDTGRNFKFYERCNINLNIWLVNKNGLHLKNVLEIISPSLLMMYMSTVMLVTTRCRQNLFIGTATTSMKNLSPIYFIANSSTTSLDPFYIWLSLLLAMISLKMYCINRYRMLDGVLHKRSMLMKNPASKWFRFQGF